MLVVMLDRDSLHLPSRTSRTGVGWRKGGTSVGNTGVATLATHAVAHITLQTTCKA